jgi:hypothetical protein
MAQQPDTLDAGLIKKGEARGTSPALAVPQPRVVGPPPQTDDPPLRALPPDDVPKRFTSSV